MNIFDLLIIGAGPAGITASIYASRYKLKNLIIGKVLGGELSLAAKICNYPGFKSISGQELAAKWQEQVKELGAEILIKEVKKIRKLENNLFSVQIDENEFYQAKALIVATGSERRRLDIPGEKEYLGKGVSYCYTCDGPFFKNKTVALIGGSDSAVSGAVHMANYVNKVYVIYRGHELKAEPFWLEEWEKIVKTGKGETIYQTNIKQILGGLELQKLKIKNKKLKQKIENLKLKNRKSVVGVILDKPYQESDLLLLDGVFVEIGGIPGTSLLQPLKVALDESGHVKVSEAMATNVKGLFCAGDMVDKSAKFKQAILAMAQGALAASAAFRYLKKETAPSIRGI